MLRRRWGRLLLMEHLGFLAGAPRHLLLTGKGGVGKTTVACAAAVQLARSGSRVLLVSTDPASNIGQTLGVTIGRSIAPVPAVSGLSALDIDPQQAAEDYRRRVLAPLEGLLPDRELATITEQLSGSCTTEIASFNEFTDLLADPAATSDFDHIIFDTAPTGHTLRLLQLPGSWTGFLDDGRGDASCLGPMSGLEKHRCAYRAAVNALADPASTRIVLVTRPLSSALREAGRTRDELAMLGIDADHLVINGTLPTGDPDPLHTRMHARQQDALAQCPENLAGMHRDQIPLRPGTMIGTDALAGLFDGEVQVPAAPGDEPRAASYPGIGALVDELDARGRGLVMTMGKGGVGKTTVASAVAVALADRGHRVRLTTTDPAAHLEATLAGRVPGLSVDAIDPGIATQAYRDHVMATKGAALDEAGRQALAEDLRSPCTEEVAVFQAFSRAVDDAVDEFVVMDTAPTGHTVLLMDATGAYHRETIRLAGGMETPSTPLMRLQDPEHTRIIIVTLPETTPVLEAAGLEDDLARAGIRPWAWVVNNALSAARTRSGILAARAATEAEQIDAVTRRASRLGVIAARGADPVGLAALRSLVAQSEHVS